jgi:hypothetical protein
LIKALDPETAGLVEKAAHLARHIAKARGHAKQDGIVVGQFGWAGDLCGLIGLAACVLEDILGHGFGHALDGDLGTADAAGAFGHGLRHGFDMTVHGVVENQHFCHFEQP